MNNSIFVIKPYKWEGFWVFDDPSVGLVKEPFVGGADSIIDEAVRHIPRRSPGLFGRVFGWSFPWRSDRSEVAT